MAASLPLKAYHSYEHYVENLERAEAFYTKVLGFKRIGQATEKSRRELGMNRVVLAGGKTIHLILSAPLTEWSVAAQYLAIHPEGIGFLNFRVGSLDEAIKFLDKRGGTFLYAPQHTQNDKGNFYQSAIATPLDGVSFRFIEDKAYAGFGPEFEMSEAPGSYTSPYKFQCIDHFTSNVRTLQPLLAFYREVLGFEEFWGIEFHTNDVNPHLPVGSGLKSKVYWHKDSGIKFANNEPAAPFFRNSQIDIYLRDNRGSGIQHAAFLVPDILSVMRDLHPTGAEFLKAPASYYEKVPVRLKEKGFHGKIRENMADLAENDILIDASEKGYLLQIFSMEMNRLLKAPKAGPLFYEIIQREGDDGFGGGNFRALFETIELDQIAMQKTAKTLPFEVV